MAGKPAARFSDTTVCPLPFHGKGAIYSGAKKVRIGGHAAARVSDQAMCPGTACQAATMSSAKAESRPFTAVDCDGGGGPAGPAGGAAGGGGTDVVAMGSATVRIEGQPAARLGDAMTHGGTIMSGCTNVCVGG